MPDYDIYPIVEEINLLDEEHFDILPLTQPILTRTKTYFKSEKIFVNLENKITKKNINIVLTKKKT